MDEQKKHDYFLPISVLVAGVLIAGSVLYTAGLEDSSRKGPASPTLDNNASAIPGGNAPEIGDSVVLGDKDAPITFVGFGDYQCSFCGWFFTNVEPQLRKEYIETGKVKMVYKHFAFLGPESVAAAEASECAKDYGKFWLYYDALFEAEIADGRVNNGNLNKQLFLSIANRLDIDVKEFEQCVDSRKYKQKIERDLAEGQAFGVQGTPATFVNDVFVSGAQSYTVFKQVIEEQLQK